MLGYVYTFGQMKLNVHFFWGGGAIETSELQMSGIIPGKTNLPNIDEI